jgi:ATP-dependent DNA helicase RecQ
MLLAAAQSALKRYFGYDQFRPLQAEIITTILQGQDSLVLMPTGGGKSLCFQIPALVLPGTCVVVSPLISLMRDQVEALKANGIAADFLNSTQNAEDQRRIENEFYDGELDLLYVSPEKLLTAQVLTMLNRGKVNLIAIDEAHCISAWGHDFRPEYTQLKVLKQQFPKVPIVALTATADKITRRDIVEQLAFQSPAIFIASFDRPNLSLEVRPGQDRFKQILDFIKSRTKQAGIIYCLSRKGTESLAEKLKGAGIKAGVYHAGLSPMQRAKVQDDFLNDNLNVVCATIAFGMGIDKSNVRWVVHYNLPKNLESYYQEIGRAGRDGSKADTLLFYSYADVANMHDMLSEGENAEQVEVQLLKLERMQQYAEAQACRRRILLAYFGENLEQNCGNCDVCKNPPQHIDGTVIAQKALSAVIRLQEKVPMGILIEVLRGSGRREIIQAGYDQIKTYGAGRDISQYDWQQYLSQLINLGYLEVAYDAGQVLRLTNASSNVLFQGQKVNLVKPTSYKDRQEQEKQAAKVKTEVERKQERVRDDLFEELRQLRREIAVKNGVPPYVVFSDKTLEEMAFKRPLDEATMLSVSGIGQQKMHQYGQLFIEAILDFVNRNLPKEDNGTYKLSLDWLKQGMSVEEIAEKRGVAPGTIMSHLAYLHEVGENVPIQKFVSSEEIKKILAAKPYLEQPNSLKGLYDYFDGNMSYDKIRLALAEERRGK